MESLSVFKLFIFFRCIGVILSNSKHSSKSTTRQTDVQTDINELKREVESLKQEVREIRKLKDDIQLVKETINNQDDIADKVVNHIKTVQTTVKVQMDEFDRVIGNLDANIKTSTQNLELKVMDSKQELSMNITEIKDQLNICNITMSSAGASLAILEQQIQENVRNLQFTQRTLESFMEHVNVKLKTARSSTTISTTPVPMPVTEKQKSCRQNWLRYENACYLFVTTHNSWDRAKTSCENYRSNLTDILSESENNFIKGYISKKKTPGIYAYWIGGSDRDQEGTFIWMHNRRRFNFTDWPPGEPNNYGYGLSEHCVGLAKTLGYRWNDFPCSKSNIFGYICKEVL